MSESSKSNVQMVLRQTNALSGTPKLLRRQALLLAKKNANVSVISDSFHPELSGHPDVDCIKTWKWPKNNLFQRKVFDWQARRISKSMAPDLVIGHGDTLNQDLLFVHTCVHKAAEISPGENKRNTSVPFHRMIFEQGSFKVLVCNSMMMKNDLTSRFKITTPTYVLYPGHDAQLKMTVDDSVVQDLRKKVTESNDKIILGVITSGNLENRGAYALIRAIALLPRDLRSKVSVLIVGKESHPEKIYKLGSELGIRDLLYWMDPRKDVANIISAADIIIHAAKMEAFGMSVLESMSLAKPIIATSTVGCTELFPEVQRDLIIDSQSPELIASKLKLILEKKDLLKALGEENARIGQAYSWDSYEQNFLNILEQEFPHLGIHSHGKS